MSQIIINSPACDWLTLTTFSYKSWAALDKLLVRSGKVESKSFGGYKGTSWGSSMFSGEGTQKEKGKEFKSPHFMIQGTGYGGYELLAFIMALPDFEHGSWKCTRIDVQVSVDYPSGYNARFVKDWIEVQPASSWLSGHAIQPQLREGKKTKSGIALDTWYVGSRNSQRLVRCYVKQVQPLPAIVSDSHDTFLDEPEGEIYLRYETQYNKEAANSAFHSLWSGSTVAEYARHGFDSVPLWCFYQSENPTNLYGSHWFYAIRQVLSGDSTKPDYAKRKVDNSATIEWLRNVVGPSVLRLANDHDLHDITKQWLIDVYTQVFLLRGDS